MNRGPIFKVREAKFRDATSSTDLNEMNSEALYDLTDIFNTLNEQEDMINEIKESLGIENKYQDKIIRELENKIIELEKEINEYKLSTSITTFNKRIYVEDIVTPDEIKEENKANVSKFYNQVTLAINGKITSKIFLIDEITNNVLIPKSLHAEVIPKANNKSIIDNDIINAFRPDDGLVWRRKYIYPKSSTVNKVTCEIIVTIPETIISNKNINTFYIKPYPNKGISIDKVQYKAATHTGNWYELPGFNSNGYKDCGNLRLYFKEKEMSQIKITMSQEKYIEENYNKVFYIGAEEIGLANTNHQSNSGEFYIKTKLTGEKNARLIKSIVPNFINIDSESDVNKLFSYNIYYIDGSEKEKYLRDKLPVISYSEDIILKCKLYLDSDTNLVPIINYIDIEYEDIV